MMGAALFPRNSAGQGASALRPSASMTTGVVRRSIVSRTKRRVASESRVSPGPMATTVARSANSFN